MLFGNVVDRALRVVVVALMICAAACRNGPTGGSAARMDSGSTAGIGGGSTAGVGGGAATEDGSVTDGGSAPDDGSVVDGSSVVDLGPVVPVGSVATAPGAATCPADHPVLCSTQCCAAGTACADGGVPGVDAGSCVAATSAPVCPPDAPVTCSAAPTTTADGGVLAYDESVHGAHASVFAPAAFGEGRASAALDLPAAWPCRLDTIGAATAPALELSAGDQPHSIEAWVRLPGGTALQAIAGFGGVGLNGSLLGARAGLASFNGCDRGALTPAVWHHVAGVYLGGGNTSLYVDGALSGTCAQAGLTLPARPTVVFGNAQMNPPCDPQSLICPLTWQPICAPFSGQVDEVRIVSRPLSAADISADFAAARLPVTADTLGLWRFDEGAPARCCPAGSTCDPGGRCSAAAGGGAPACPAGAPVSCGNGTCCPAGTSCGAKGCTVALVPAGCPPARPVSCGDGSCCPAGNTCLPQSQCSLGMLAVPANDCGGGGTACGAGCCPSGSTCLVGVCVAAAPVGIACGANGHPCGSVCCPALTVCARPGVCAQAPRGAACGAGFSGACSAVGPCCRDGFVCKGSIRNAAGFSCVATGAAVPHGGFAGPACGGGFCAAGAVCGGATCCAADHPSACGASCCLAGATCTGGNTCGCSAAFPVVCGNSCCADGFGCFAGLCAPSCPGPNGTKVPTCGGRCCANGAACVAGACVAPVGGSDGGSDGAGGKCSITRAQCCSGGASLCGVPPATCDGCPTDTRKGIICTVGSACNTMGGITAGYQLCHCQ